jgi:hypothetical protein
MTVCSYKRKLLISLTLLSSLVHRLNFRKIKENSSKEQKNLAIPSKKNRGELLASLILCK